MEVVEPGPFPALPRTGGSYDTFLVHAQFSGEAGFSVESTCKKGNDETSLVNCGFEHRRQSGVGSVAKDSDEPSPGDARLAFGALFKLWDPFPLPPSGRQWDM